MAQATITTEELEAQALEGMDRISPEGQELLTRYLELNRQAAVIKNEKDAIAELIKEEMSKKNATALTHNGRVVVELVHSSSTKADLTSIRKFFPEVAAQFIKTSETTKFDVKK